MINWILIPVGKGEMGSVGDSWDRYMIRYLEIKESIKIYVNA